MHTFRNMTNPSYVQKMKLKANDLHICNFQCKERVSYGSGVPSGGGGLGCSKPPSPKFRRPSKIVTNSTRLWKLLKIAEFRMPALQDVRKKGSKILKVRNCFTLLTYSMVQSPSWAANWFCFTLAMTNKLVVIVNSLKVPKIKNILLYEVKFLVPNYSCLQNPWQGGYRPQTPIFSVLCPQLHLLNPPSPRKKFLGTPLSYGTLLFHSWNTGFRETPIWGKTALKKWNRVR